MKHTPGIIVQYSTYNVTQHQQQEFFFKKYGTVNQQIFAAIKVGVSQNKVIWQLLNLASPCLCSVRSTSFTYVGGDKY